MSLPTSVKKLIEEHLQGLKSQLHDYFPSPDVQCSSSLPVSTARLNPALCLFPLTDCSDDDLCAADLRMDLVFLFT
ncbi:hypothetical protein QQF64_029917 [Cirrhinus molitorella]|uniref:Uncharacterized protein n=1 Tax=Cirrhinus molitorella TaxID=172907 RepID=A0ABR3N265_9TELE